MLKRLFLALLVLCALTACGSAPDETVGATTEDLNPLIVHTHMNVRIGTHIPAGIVDGCINMSADPNNYTSPLATLGVAACWTPGQPIGDAGFYRFSERRVFSDINLDEWNALVVMLNTLGVQTVSTITYDFHAVSPLGFSDDDKVLTSIAFNTIPIP